MKIIKDINSTVDIRFEFWELSRIIFMLEGQSRAKVDEDMLKKMKAYYNLYE